MTILYSQAYLIYFIPTEREINTEKYNFICDIVFDLGIHLAGDKISAWCR